jgi:hypothetical protein
MAASKTPQVKGVALATTRKKAPAAEIHLGTSVHFMLAFTNNGEPRVKRLEYDSATGKLTPLPCDEQGESNAHRWRDVIDAARAAGGTA